MSSSIPIRNRRIPQDLLYNLLAEGQQELPPPRARSLMDIINDINQNNPLEEGDLERIENAYKGDPRLPRVLDYLKSEEGIKQPKYFNEIMSQEIPKEPRISSFRAQGPSPLEVAQSQAPQSPPPVPFVKGPRTDYPYYYNVPKRPVNDHVFVGNRENFQGNWYPIGSQIDEKAVGPKTYSEIGKDGTFSPQHHKNHIGILPSEQGLKEKLSKWGAQTTGNDDLLRQRYAALMESDLDKMRSNANRLMEGRALDPISDEEITQSIAGHRPLDMERATQERLQRMGGSVPQQPVQLEPSRLIGRGTNPMTISNMPGAAGAARETGLAGALSEGEGAAATGSMGAMGGASMFASRAMPILGLALMGAQLLQGSRANIDANRSEETHKSMRM